MKNGENEPKESFTNIRPFTTAVVLLLLSVFAVWFPRSSFYAEQKEGLIYMFQEAALSAGLRLDEIFVSGRVRTPKKDLIDSLNAERGMPLTAVDLNLARETIQRLPWIKSVRIERRLPCCLYVRVQERTPVAVWQHNGIYNPVDEDGQVIETTAKQLKNLPLVVGDDAPEKTPELLKFAAQEPELHARVKAAVRVGRRRWNIVLDDLDKGITVMLPEKDPASAWSRLARLNRTQEILKRKITMIDLRLPDKLTVRLEKTQRKKASKTKTGNVPENAGAETKPAASQNGETA